MVPMMPLLRRFLIIIQFYCELLHVNQIMFSYTPDKMFNFKVIHGWNPQIIEIRRTLRSIIEYKFSWVMLLVYRRDRLISWSRTEHTTQDMSLHTNELALHTTGPICFDSLACLQIAFLTFECSLQLLVLPNVCLTIIKTMLWKRLFLWHI